MKMKQYIKGATLALAAIATVGMAVPDAHAAWTTGPGTAVVVIDQGLNSLTAKTGAATTNDLVYTLAAGESLAIGDTIIVTLTGGLTFGAVLPKLLPSAGDIGAGTTTASVPLSGGTTGSTTATWRAITAVASGSTLTLQTTTVTTSLSVIGVKAGVNADIQLTLKTSTNLTIGTANHSAKGEPTAKNFAFTGSNLVVISANTAVAADTAQVATGFKFLNAAGTNKTATLFAITATPQNGGATLPATALAAKKLLFTITGNFNGVTSVTVVAAKVTGDDGTGAAAGTVDTFTINAAKTKAFAVSTSSLGGALGVTSIVINYDGTTAQPARAFTMTVDVLADAAYSAHSVQVATTAYTLARNGTAFVANSVGALNKVRVTDRSGSLGAGGADGSVTMTAYNAAGTACTAIAVSTVPNNGSVDVLGSAVQAACPGTIRLEGVVNSTAIEVTNIKNNPTTGGINVSPAVVANGAVGGI